jgi:hypothetical protein
MMEQPKRAEVLRFTQNDGIDRRAHNSALFVFWEGHDFCCFEGFCGLGRERQKKSLRGSVPAQAL